MMPIGLLMIEHRLIERMVRKMEGEAARMKKDNTADVAFIDTAVDFMRTYADKLHHGKEEDILFRDMKKKELSPEHERIMSELISEHVYGRSIVKKLEEAKNNSSVKDAVVNMEILIKFYPKHIEKEDKHFFIPVMKYFNREEQGKMLDEMNKFDRNFNLVKYQSLVERLEGK